MILPIKYNVLSTSQGIDASLEKLKDAIFSELIDGTVTFKQAIMACLAFASGTTDIDTGGPNPVVSFFDPTGAKARIQGTMIASERSSVTNDFS